MTGDLRLPVVLRHTVAAAQDLLGARYAALGVLGGDGGLEQFLPLAWMMIWPLIPCRRGSRRDIRR